MIRTPVVGKQARPVITKPLRPVFEAIHADVKIERIWMTPTGIENRMAVKFVYPKSRTIRFPNAPIPPEAIL
jgi:hypothetical protein